MEAAKQFNLLWLHLVLLHIHCIHVTYNTQHLSCVPHYSGPSCRCSEWCRNLHRRTFHSHFWASGSPACVKDGYITFVHKACLYMGTPGAPWDTMSKLMCAYNCTCGTGVSYKHVCNRLHDFIASRNIFKHLVYMYMQVQHYILINYVYVFYQPDLLKVRIWLIMALHKQQTLDF